MCPARPLQLKKKPYKAQRELKHPRHLYTLRTYAKRRKAYAISYLIVLCTFFSRYLPELRAWRKEQRKIQARPGNKARQRKHRKLVRLTARISRLQERRAQLADQIAQLQERIQIKQWHLRKHATVHDGHMSGWNAVVPWTEAEMRAQSYSQRFIRAYLESVAEHKRINDLVAAQQKPTVQHKAIIV